jgi:hypothetical protein
MRTARLFWRTLQQRGCQPDRPARRLRITSRTWRQALVYTAAVAADVVYTAAVAADVDWCKGCAALWCVIKKL